MFTRISILTGGSSNTTAIASQRNITIKTTWEAGDLNSWWKISSDLQSLRPDLVWFNLGASVFGRSPLANLAGFLSPFMARSLGIPTVVTLHELVEQADLAGLKSPGGPLAPFGARLLTLGALQADVVCLTMKQHVDWLSKHHNGKKSIHIPIGAYYKPEILVRPADLPRELLFFTTLAPFKGLELLLQAFQQLQTTRPDLHLTIAGVPHARFPGYESELKLNFSHLSNLSWLGSVPEAQVRDLFQQAEIVCIPYTATTGSSSVLYQAAMWGRAIVASDLAETKAVARESNLEAAFFQSGSSSSLAAVLKELLDSPELQKEQVRRNFAAIQHHRPEEICRIYLQAFNLALETSNSPKRLAIPGLANRELS